METTNSVSEEWGLAEATSYHFERFIVIPKEDFMFMWAYRQIATGTFAEMEALKKLMNAAHGNN